MLALRRVRGLLTLVLVLVNVGIARVAYASDGDPVTEPKTEFTALPIVGGSSDFGWGGGALAAIGRVAPGVSPYVWRIEVASTTLARFSRPVTVPYQDHYVLFTLAQVVPNRLRLELRPSFTREGQLKYSGLGNASQPPDLSETERGRYEYARTHPTMRVGARLELPSNFALRIGIQATYDVVEVADGTALARDRRSESTYVREALRGPDQHGVVLFEWAAVYDTRDDEVSTERGQWHRVQLRLSPGGTPAFPYRYGQANVSLRAYVTPVPRRLTFAGRLVGDALFGDVPFYELARYADETYALGGGNGVRGVLAQRYYGKVKVFGNAEARSRLFDFSLFGKDMALAVVGFFDAGRLWFDFAPHPDLDGAGLGLKYGVGGGLRLHAGKTFVARADVAWSPDAFPIGAYFQANETF